MKRNKIFQIIVFVFLLIFMINSSYNYILNNFLIKTDIVEEKVFLRGYETQGFVFGNETLLKANSSGNVDFLASEGQRISKNYPVARIEGKDILSPTSGIITFKYDKLEEVGDPFESSTFDLEEVKLNYTEYDNTGKTTFQKGNVILKITDNLETPKLYLELPIISFEEPLQLDQVLTLKLPEEKNTIQGKVVKLKGIGQNALLVLEFLDMPKDYNRIQDVKIVSEEIKTYMIPKNALKTVENKTGIYVVRKGMLNFREINIIGEEGESLLTDSLETNTEIVTKPRFASDGKYIR